MSAIRYDNLSDGELAGLAQGGDRRAMDVLIARYEPLRSKLLYQFGLYLDRDLRKDLASEILYGTIDLINKYDASVGAPLAAWLKKYLWQKTRDAMQKMVSATGHMALDEERDGDAEPSAVGASPVGAPPDAHARYAELMDALEERLDPLRFRIFQLWFWECSYEEIAGLLGISVSQVRNAMSRKQPPGALQIAREVLSEHGYA